MSYHVMICEQKDPDFLEYAHAVCSCSKNIYNVGNFYIRNTMTGIKKEPEQRFQYEREVLTTVFESIEKQNKIRCSKLPKNLKNTFMKEEKEPYEKMLQKLNKAKDTKVPTPEYWFLNYEKLDMVFKQSENPDYNAAHKQYIQNALKKITAAWDSYFKQLNDYRKSPGKYTGLPKIPKYKKGSEITARISGVYLVFHETDQGTEILFPSQNVNGKKVRGSIIMNNMPDEKLAIAEIQPFHGRYRIILTFGESDTEELTEHIPKNIMGIDPGVNNFATITDNLGNEPIIIKGGFMKARNQYYNKRRAELLSKLTKGKDSKHSLKHSHALDSISRKRCNFFRDCFYKISHTICRIAQKRGIDTIVIGHSAFWKQESNTGKINNQNFVAIPFNQFFDILTYVASQYDIVAVVQEESYTSQASFLDNDAIPIYKKGVSHKGEFSGVRPKRGLYRSKDRILFNADVNGSANIIKKYYPNAFEGVNKEYLYKNKIIVFGFSTFYKDKVA